MAAVPWLWFYPDPPPGDTPARHVSTVDIPRDAKWAGGFSGMDVATDGLRFLAVTDRGVMAKGRFVRVDGQLTDISLDTHQALVGRHGDNGKFPFTDAEGVALDTEGRAYVSFEHAHRVLVYDSWGGPARWPSYTRAWRALANNKGLEAIAISEGGTLYAIPEGISSGALDALVYRRRPNQPWQQAFTLPVDPAFAPVGADFGPDGKLYVLERGIYPFGFFSRVRAMSVTADAFAEIETVLQTRLGAHGNLEGLSVWDDAAGHIRLTMISDNNFYPFMRSQIVEYVVPDGVASPTK